MTMENAIMEVNANFHHLSGEDVCAEQSSRFSEYRKKWKEWPENFSAGDFPLFIDIETTSACNLRCPFCATTYRGEAVQKGFIPYPAVKKIIDQGAGNNLYGVKFNVRGEPLLHPEIDRFVRYAKQKGLLDVYFNTNAMLLTEEMSQRLVDAGLDRLSVSFEGYTQEVYQRHRPGANYETVMSNIENMQRLKKKLGVRHPRIRIQAVMLPDVLLDVDGYQQFWGSRVEEVSLLDYKRMQEKRKGIAYPWACPQIWQRMVVWWDGTILPCNHDDDALLVLGNLDKMSLKEAWQSMRLSEIRMLHKKGLAHQVSACDGCYLRDSEMLKLSGRNAL